MSFIKILTSCFLTISILTTLRAESEAEVVNKILAHVGRKVITTYDAQNLDPENYRKIMEIKEEAYRESQLKEYYNQALDYLINQEVISISAEREGITVKEEEIDTAIAEITKRNNIEPDKLEEYLAKEGMSLNKYRFQLRNDILNARVRSQVLMPKIVVVEKDLKALADEKSDEFQLHDKYNVRILMTQNRKSLDTAVKAIKKGMAFEEAVKKYSIDKSAVNGGALGWIEADLLSGDMKKALLETKIGKMSKPFETNGQWAVFMVDEFKSKYDFDAETKAKLQEAASEKIFNNVFNTWLDRNKDTIVIMRSGEVLEAR